MSPVKLAALMLSVYIVVGCARPLGTFEGRCSKSPDLNSLNEDQILALRDATERSSDACISSGMDCSRYLHQTDTGKFTVLIDVSQWNDETNQCEGLLGSLAAYMYSADGKFERELLAI